jgi:hypothetical protein
MADGMCCATEHQGNDTPHAHGIFSPATPYRNKTLHDLQKLITEGLCTADAIKKYVTHMCHEEHFDLERHEENLDELEKEWSKQHPGRAHERLAFRPQWQKNDIRPPNMATGPSQRKQKPLATTEYKAAFEQNAQHVFSCAQYHWHNLSEDGKTRMPQPYCRDKTKQRVKKGAHKKHGRNEVCKQDFPRKLNLVSPEIICAGLARKYGLKVKGRRNALSLIRARRNCAWLNGTTPLLSVLFRSNSDVKPNFRIPLTPATHESSCEANCLQGTTDEDARCRRLCVIAQRAMKQMTGYFCGYTCKRQPVGKFQMKTARRMLHKVTEKLKGKNVSKQKAHLITKLYNILEGRGKLQTCAEMCI